MFVKIRESDKSFAVVMFALAAIFCLAFIVTPMVFLWAINTISAACGFAFYIEHSVITYLAVACVVWFIQSLRA